MSSHSQHEPSNVNQNHTKSQFSLAWEILTNTANTVFSNSDQNLDAKAKTWPKIQEILKIQKNNNLNPLIEDNFHSFSHIHDNLFIIEKLHLLMLINSRLDRERDYSVEGNTC